MKFTAMKDRDRDGPKFTPVRENAASKFTPVRERDGGSSVKTGGPGMSTNGEVKSAIANASATKNVKDVSVTPNSNRRDSR